MEIIHQKYKELGPSINFLCDEAVMIQAWKKCDTYIRRHNWYADILELELASLMLPELIPTWCEEVKNGSVAPEGMRLIQAPKNSRWEFPQNEKKKASAWKYALSDNSLEKQEEDAGPELRPLAHLGIREQTFATAAMICLANIIETVQGNTEQESYKKAQEQGVFSYGNRLFCDWQKLSNGKEQAYFRWGNATTYTQFFDDYQRFLFRPAEICQAAPVKQNKENLFVVKLDLSKFYDRIDREKLIQEIEKIINDYSVEFENSLPAQDELDKFSALLKEIITWKWGASAKREKESKS